MRVYLLFFLFGVIERALARGLILAEMESSSALFK